MKLGCDGVVRLRLSQALVMQWLLTVGLGPGVTHLPVGDLAI